MTEHLRQTSSTTDTPPSTPNPISVKALLLEPLMKRPKQAAIAFSLLILATLCDVVGPWLTQYYLDHQLVPHHFDAKPLIFLVVAYLLTQVVAATCRYLQTIRFAHISTRAIQEIRNRVFEHLLRLPQSRIDATPLGELTNRVTSDTDALQEFYLGFLSSVVQNVILLVGIIIAMLLIDLRLALIALLIVPIGILLIVLYKKLAHPAVTAVRRLRAKQSAQLNEAIQGMTVIQAFSQGQRFQKRFDSVGKEQYRERIRIVIMGGLLLRSAINFLTILLMAGLIYGYGITHISVGDQAIGIGVLYAFIKYLDRVAEPLIDISQRFSLFQRASVAATRLLELLNSPEEEAGHDTRPINDINIELNDVRFRHDGASHDTLKGLDLTIKPGTFVGIVGATGSGKSTLLDLLSGLKRTSQGELLIDGRPLASIERTTLSDKIAVVPQEPFMRSTTLRDNLLLGTQASDPQLEKAIHAARLNTLIERLPDGLDTRLGERGLTLSSGERQLLALARALLRQPKILLLDEATASIDSTTETELSEALNALRGQVTLIVVAHRLATIAEADLIVVMADGRIIERGSHEVLLGNTQGAYHALWNNALQNEGESIES
ncbi:Multidrug resistance-like ATP-binding protein MdlB [Halomonadaceae bacterium LMG 33818]|uniref:ABC transporter ATP-binding protein n=1 Tax=Cernens ardua TaxID=3402176 RepID=UPI003EDC8C69